MPQIDATSVGRIFQLEIANYQKGGSRIDFLKAESLNEDGSLRITFHRSGSGAVGKWPKLT